MCVFCAPQLFTDDTELTPGGMTRGQANQHRVLAHMRKWVGEAGRGEVFGNDQLRAALGNWADDWLNEYVCSLATVKLRLPC